MAKSSTANGGTSFFNIDIQEVSSNKTQYVLRVRVRLTSRNVIDSNNRFRVTGAWTRDTSQSLNGTYSNTLVWTSGNLTVPRRSPGGGPTIIEVRLRWSGVEYWGSTLDGTAFFSVPAQAAVKPSAPGTPVVRPPVTPTSVALDWTAPVSNGGAAINDYRLQRATNSSFTSGSWSSYPAGRADTHTGLTPNTTYYFRVRARNSVGGGTWSGTRSVTTPPTTPGAPTSWPSFSDISATSVTIASHLASSTGGAPVLEYQGQVATNTAFTTGVRSVSLGTSRSGTVTGLPRATQHYGRTRARNSAGWGPWSTARPFTTLPAPPVLSNGATHHSVTRNSARVYGTPISDTGGQAPTNHRVQYNTSASESGASVRTAGSWAQVTLTGLSDDTTYYYRRSAANSGGWGPWTTWQSFTTLSAGPGDMEPPTFSEITETEARATWTIPALGGATFLRIESEWDTDPNFSNPWRSQMYSPETTTKRVGLLPGRTYYVRIRLVTTGEFGGTGAWAEGSFTTEGASPAPGLRVYTFVAGQRYECVVYTFVDGARKKLSVGTSVGGEMKS